MYKTELSRQAEKELKRVFRSDRTLYDRFLRAFHVIAQNPSQGKPLQGPLRGLLSHRFGNYRILYEIHHHRLLILIIDLGHRRDIYK